MALLKSLPFLSRRRLETAAVTIVAIGAGAAIASEGPLFKRNGLAPVAAITARPAAAAPATPAAVRWEVSNIENKAVDAWVARLTGPMKPSLGIYMRRMQRYDGMITQKAAAAGLPSELVYLAMIESGGNPTAKSPVRARGLWQFMSGTAKSYGLTVRGGRDDRLDPALATDAALRYLGDLHEQFGSWYLAAAAYNAGQGRVGKVLKEVTGRTKGTDADFYRIAHRLPKETRDYVPKFIAVARVAKEPERYGITPEYIASRPLTERPVVAAGRARGARSTARVAKAARTKHQRGTRGTARATRAGGARAVAAKAKSARGAAARKALAKRSVAKASAKKRTVVKASAAKRSSVKASTAKRSAAKGSAVAKRRVVGKATGKSRGGRRA